MKKLSHILIILGLCLLALPALPASAQSGDEGNGPDPVDYLFPDDPGVNGTIVLYDSNGNPVTISTSDLTPTGIYTENPPEGYPYYESQIPGVSGCLGCMSYHTYVTPDGQTLMLPNPYTVLLLATSEEARANSYLGQHMDAALLSDAVAMMADAGMLESIGIKPGQAGLLQNLQSVLNGSQNPLALLQFMMAMNDPSNDLYQQGWLLNTAVFMVDCNPVTGECVRGDEIVRPGDPYEPICTLLGCPPIDETCDSKGGRQWEIKQAAPTYQVVPLAPPYPVVVGQDPERRGLDLQVKVVIAPVYVSYNYTEIVNGESVCRWHSDGGHSGCAGGYDRLDSPAGEWYNDGHWGVDQDQTKVCSRRTDTYADHVALLTASLDLTGESVAWIENELASKYPGAHVYQAHWPLYPAVPPQVGGLSADAASFDGTYLALQLQDPGQYLVTVNGATTGTPFTRGLALSYTSDPIEVFASFVALTK